MTDNPQASAPSVEPPACAQCQRTFPAGELWPVEDRSFCAPCLSELGEVVRAHFRELGANPNMLGAFLWGSGAAAVGVFAWYFITMQSGARWGILAVALGWLVGKAVVRGAGNKRGRTLQAMSVAMTAAAIVACELAITSAIVQGDPPVWDLFALWAKTQDLFGWLILAIALYEAWVVPKLPKV